jgi:hypothetical protein
MSGDDELTAENVAMMAAERLQRVDGFGPWGQALPDDHEPWRGLAIATIGVCANGSWTELYLTAEPLTAPEPEFDWGARADDAHDAQVDRELGVTP